MVPCFRMVGKAPASSIVKGCGKPYDHRKCPGDLVVAMLQNFAAYLNPEMVKTTPANMVLYQEVLTSKGIIHQLGFRETMGKHRKRIEMMVLQRGKPW